MRKLEEFFDFDEVSRLVSRLELLPSILRRKQEEFIANIVPLDTGWVLRERESFSLKSDLHKYLDDRGWSDHDLNMELWRNEALLRFARHRFGPGVEALFLESEGGLDEVIYSLLRVRDMGLARELWIRLEEGELTFSVAAQEFSEGPEAHRLGIMGPMHIGTLQPPELVQWLRSLRPGEISPPRPIGEWFVLLRLEKLTPARLDDPMRDRLLLNELDRFLDARVQQLLAGDILDEIHYDSIT